MLNRNAYSRFACIRAKWLNISVEKQQCLHHFFFTWFEKQFRRNVTGQAIASTLEWNISHKITTRLFWNVFSIDFHRASILLPKITAKTLTAPRFRKSFAWTVCINAPKQNTGAEQGKVSKWMDWFKKKSRKIALVWIAACFQTWPES